MIILIGRWSNNEHTLFCIKFGKSLWSMKKTNWNIFVYCASTALLSIFQSPFVIFKYCRRPRQMPFGNSMAVWKFQKVWKNKDWKLDRLRVSYQVFNLFSLHILYSRVVHNVAPEPNFAPWQNLFGSFAFYFV